ncbi:MAG: FAD-dependent oxidoreductase [Polyangiaceae bacterium]
MARTPLFSSVRRALARALFAKKHGLSDPAEVERAWEAQKLKRRAVLQWSAAALSVAALPAMEGCDGDGTPSDPTGAKVVVIGGGMAGVHCTYRLAKAGVDVTLYEASKRVGGRMYTARDQFADGQLCELGGELIDTGHATLHSLATELGIALDDRWADEPAGFKREIYYMAGVEIPEETIVEQFTPVADIMAMQVEKAETDDAYFEEIDNISLQEWLDTHVPKDTSPELHEILRVAYRGEYGLETTEQSCLNLLYFIDWENPEDFAIFGDSDERYHTHLGNDTFPTTLAADLTDKIELETKLVMVKDSGDGKYLLGFEKADGTKVEVTADHVVFALPYTLLREVDLSGLSLSDLKSQIINELGYGTNAKVMTGYTSRVWKTDHNAGGAVTTDLAIQQTWETSIGQDGASGILTNFLGGDGGLASGDGTPEEYHQKVLPDLEEIWPGTQAAYVKDSAVRMHWPTHEFTKGSYTCYTPGQWAFYGFEGEREGNLHFIGEHTSLDFQGFMEGAAESGAFAAAEILEELEIAPSEQLARLLDTKLGVPQPWYRGGAGRRMRLSERRRLRRAALELRLSGETG